MLQLSQHFVQLTSIWPTEEASCFLELVISWTVTDIPLMAKLHLSWKRKINKQMTWGLMSKELWPHLSASPEAQGAAGESRDWGRKPRREAGGGQACLRNDTAYLGERDSKRHSSDDSHVGLHETGHQIITTLQRERDRAGASETHFTPRPGSAVLLPTYTLTHSRQIQLQLTLGTH